MRYPSYHEGQIAFCYLGDLWTAREDGTSLQRLTVHKARDVYPKFSPDGRWIAFSSERDGNLDVFVIPSQGGNVKALTGHSADDTVLGWTPDAKRVLFASQRGEDFMGKLYTVDLDGGMPRNAGPDMGVYASYSPDGTRLAVNRKSQAYWRKYYRGAYQSDVTVMDLAAKSFKDLTDFAGMDSWPLWSTDGHIYFVSDRQDKGLTNLWRVPESGGDAEQVSDFTEGDVRWPSISADGKTIVFEHDFGIWKLDLGSKKVVPIPLEIAAETQESLIEYREFNSQVDDYDLAPSGKQIAFSIRGELFTAPTDEGDLRQLTDGASRDQDVQYAPDGKSIAFVSDKSGREEVFVVAADGAGEAKKVTDVDALKSSYAWSPDSKRLAVTTSDGKLSVVAATGENMKELLNSKYGNLSRPSWSPDGKWLAYSKPDVSRATDIYLIPADGGEERKVTFDSSPEMNPRFSADGKKLYFLRVEASPEAVGGLGNQRPSSQLFVVPLEKQERDPEEAEAKAEPPTVPNPESMARRLAARNQPPKEPNIDWPGLKRRTRQVTRASGPVSNYAPAHDGKTLVFVAREGSGPVSSPTLYSIQDDGKRLTRLAADGTPSDNEGDGSPRGPRGFFGRGMSNLKVAHDGRSVYYQDGGSVYSATLSFGGPSGGPGMAAGGSRFAALAAMAGGSGDSSPSAGGRRRVNFTVRVRVDKPAEWSQMFDDAWRTMKYRFYDPKMHGYDWDAARAKYRPLVEFVGDRQELMSLINEMIGELNASHTGATAGRERGQAGGVTTGHLGLDLEPDEESGRYKVTHVYEGGPADKDWIKIGKGDYILAFDGKLLKAGDDYWDHLGRRLNRKVELTVNSKPSDDGAWKVRIDPVPVSAFSQLRYERWVKERRTLVDTLSNGRVGYLHIQAMNASSLRKFEKELREFRHKEGLVIDERWNGGGNIEQELLALLVQRPYQVWQPRGTEPTPRPFAGYFGPKVVLQNWRSASNAEMFPAGFRALGLGKVIGTPTMGAVIGTGSYSLIDGSSVRTPGVGVFLADEARTNLENTGVKPDVPVENSPEDNLAGRDRQLETAVEEVLKQLKPSEAAGGER